MKRILSFFLAFLFIAGLITSSVDLTGYASSTIPDSTFKLKYREEEGYIPATESWMVTWTSPRSLSAGQEIHLYNDYADRDGNNSITWRFYGYDFYINGKLYEKLWDGFYFDLHIPYESWHALMDENGVIKVEFIIYGYSGHSQHKPIYFYADEDVPPNKGCTHNELEPYDVPGAWQYKECPNDSLRHYLSYNEYYQRCKCCHQVFEDQRFSESYTPDNSPIKDIHVAGGDDNCPLCGARLSDEANYLSYLSMYIRLGDNPMYDDRITEPMHKRFHDAGYTDAQWENINTVLTNADEKYRNIYLLSFFTYSQCMMKLEIDVTDALKAPIILANPIPGILTAEVLDSLTEPITININGNCNYVALELSNKLTMYSGLDPADFEHTFFHESGHAAELQPWTVKDARTNYKNIETSPFKQTEFRIFDALKEDVKSKIAETVEGFSPADNIDVVHYAFLLTPSLTDEQKESFNDKCTKLINYYNNSEENALKDAHEAEQLYQAMLYEYYQVTGTEVPVDINGTIPEAYKNLLINLFVEDRSFGLNLPPMLKENSILNAYFIKVRNIINSDLYTLDMGITNYNSSMVSDIYGGITNSKLNGRYGHAGKNNELKEDDEYWYNKDTHTPTTRQIREAWAEYYSAMIRNDSDCIKNNEQYFPTATVELEHLADEILDYYMEQFNMPSPPPPHHSQQQK